KGGYDFSEYKNALDSYIKTAPGGNATDLQRIAICYSALGTDNAFIRKTLAETIGKFGIMSELFGLILLDSGEYPGDANEITERILSLALPDGGWALSGKNSDIDVTAIAIQALSVHYETPAVKAAVDRALAFISEKQLENGDFASFGTRNCESTAQVLSALTALDIDFNSDERFIKNGNSVLDGLLLYKLPDGSFCHTPGGEANDLASVQVMLSLVYAWRQTNGLNGLYGFGDKKAESDYISETEGVKTEYTEPTDSLNTLFRKWACIAVAVLALFVIGYLFLAKKASIKKILIVIIVIVIAVSVIFIIEVQSVEEYYQENIEDIKPNSNTVFISIRCDTAAEKSDSEHIPKNGVILDKKEYVLREGDTVFDILERTVKHNRIQMEYDGGDNAALVYIEGINNIYQYDFGALSGWLYKVNGVFSGDSCSEYVLSNGDYIEWVYSCNLGEDVGVG
ncbi:MAG: DUF4430 domain-containing protein, partial [Eubacteriales bacterium]|nr:DUF4430 domain-containing protein [Eubacteriales bacterium]